MPDLMSKFSSGELIAVIAIVGGISCAVVAIVADYWFKFQQTVLKREMLARGMSAEEIMGVLNAGVSGCGRARERVTQA